MTLRVVSWLQRGVACVGDAVPVALMYAGTIRVRLLTIIVSSGLAVPASAVTSPELDRSTASVARSIAGGKSRIGGIERFPSG